MCSLCLALSTLFIFFFLMATPTVYRFLGQGSNSHLHSYSRPCSQVLNPLCHSKSCSLFYFELSPFFLFFLLLLLLFFFFHFRVTPIAHGGSQARGQNGPIAAALCHSHSNARSEPHPQPTPTLQLMATPVSQPTERGQGSNPQPHGHQLDSLLLRPNGNSNPCYFLIKQPNHLNICYSLNACIPSMHMLKRNAQCDSIYQEVESLRGYQVKRAENL